MCTKLYSFFLHIICQFFVFVQYFLHVDSHIVVGVACLRFSLGVLLMQLAVLAGDFLLSRACVALASLKNTEVR